VLLGGRLTPAPPHPPTPLDPGIPTGTEERSPPRPAVPSELSEPPACSLRYALCVHRGAGVQEATVLVWLSDLETAYERLVGALRLPPPLPDGDRGGSAALDVYLTADAVDLRVELDARDVGRTTDSASAFCVASVASVASSASVAPGGDVTALRAATLCLGEAIALRLDAAETPFSRRGLATELWLATGSPTSADARAFDDVQAHPERAVLARERSDLSEGSALLFEYLDATKGRGGPASVALATAALSARRVSPVAFRFTNEPDLADVLRATFGGTPSDVSRFFGDFAVARAFVGARDREGAIPSLLWLGDFGRVRFEWTIESKSLPRQLAPSRPVEPTGATYLWVSLGEDAVGKTLAFQADWEPPVAFRWTLVLVARDGRPVRRIEVPFLERGTHVERVVTDLENAAGLLIAGTNLGGLGPTYPFDPDFEPFEPHGYSVALAMQ
jgi:hypothetical protein